MSQNQSQFSILEALIITSSVNNEDRVVDVKSNIIELDFFENLYNPYVDALVVLIDDFGLKNALNIQGTERLKIVIGNPDSPEEASIIKYFFFSKINDVKRVNERSEIISLSLVEEHVYINSIKQFSRSYTDSLENIISDISINELGRNVRKVFFDGSVQGARKIIVPYMSPLESINWLKDRATTRTGGPLFLYGSLYEDNLLMSDLDNLLKEDVVNDKLPLRYSSAISSMDAQSENLRPYYEIISFKEVGADNSLALYENGAIGSYYANLDVGSGVVLGDHISIRDIIDEFYTNQLISDDTLQSIYDPSLEIDGRLSDEYNSLHIHQVSSSNTYNQFKSYHDESIILNNDNSLNESKLKIKNKIIRTILKKNIIDIGMSGSLFFQGAIPVGRKLRVLFLNSNVQGDNKDPIKQIDTKKSGDYVILAIHHKLTSEKHTSVLRLSKLGELPKDIKL